MTTSTTTTALRKRAGYVTNDGTVIPATTVEVVVKPATAVADGAGAPAVKGAEPRPVRLTERVSRVLARAGYNDFELDAVTEEEDVVKDKAPQKAKPIPIPSQLLINLGEDLLQTRDRLEAGFKPYEGGDKHVRADWKEVSS
jgi:hypothetical protein